MASSSPITAIGHGKNKQRNYYGWKQNKTKLSSSVSNGTLRMTAWAFLMLQPFSSADALFCMFLLHSPSVFMDISVFQASTSPSNFSEVVQQIQEFLWRTDR